MNDTPTNRATSPVLDYAIEPHLALWRTRLALVLAVGTGLASGWCLSIAGEGILPSWLFLSTTCPILACLVARSRYVLTAIVVNATMMIVVLMQLARLAAKDALPAPHERGVVIIYAALAIMSVAIGAFVGIAFSRRQRRHSRRAGTG